MKLTPGAVFVLLLLLLFMVITVCLPILTQLCANIVSSVFLSVSRQSKEKCSFFFCYRHTKKVQNFFFSLLAKNSPPTINIFCVPCLLSKKRRTIKYFMTTKKDLIWCFQQNLFLVQRNERKTMREREKR